MRRSFELFATGLSLAAVLGTTAACQGGGKETSPPAPTPAGTSAPRAGNLACHMVLQKTGNGYDARAVIDSGTVPDGTVLTGHFKYNNGGVHYWTPPDFTVGYDAAAHAASPVAHDGDQFHVSSVLGTLQPPGNNAIRTDCGAVFAGK